MAYVELNNSHDIHSIGPHKSTSMFRKNDMDFFPDTSVLQLTDILQKKYQVFVLDMGTITTGTIRQFTQCDLRIVTFGCAPWKQGSLEDWLSRYQTMINIHPETTLFLGNLGERNDALMRKLQPFSFFPVPYISNPFQLTASEWPFFENMLKEK